MAEAEITIKEDDDLLREITQQGGTVASVSISKLPVLRARGSEDSVFARSRYTFEDPTVFDSCQNCFCPLSGCIEGKRTTNTPECWKWTLILSCGHVLCEQCKDSCARSEQERPHDPPLYQCPICSEYCSANKLPGRASVNLLSCQTAYCTGEVFTPAQHRCMTCTKNICEGCVSTHEQRFPDHELTPRVAPALNPKRAFTGCAHHQEPVTHRCDCGEMLCNRCPYNYLSLIPGTNRVQNHAKTNINEADLTLEDALEDTIGTVSRIRAMRSLATQKKQELEVVTDNLANEVAVHFNQIIIQTIQRCFDVLKGVKEQGAIHYAAIENHLKMLDKTERQLSVGIELDERARSRSTVKVESVAQYVRNVSYGLCKPALEQFEDSKEFSAQLSSAPFDLVIDAHQTRDLIARIGKWGETVYTNAEDVSKKLKQAQIPPSARLEAASMVHSNDLADILNGSAIAAKKIPTRLHSALEHFTDLYERRFVSRSMLRDGTEVPEGHKRELPFQLGVREAPEARMTEEQIEARHAYERLMSARPGMHLNQPKIFGGFRRIYNLADRPLLSQKDVQTAYGKTPCLAPIWLPEENDAETTLDLEDRKHTQQQFCAATAASAAGSSRSPSVVEEILAAAASVDSNADEIAVLSPPTSSDAPKQEKAQEKPKKVFRNKNLLFLKRPAPAVQPRPESPPVLIPEEEPRLAFGVPAPSRLLGASILRRPLPQQQLQQLPATGGSKIAFRPASAAECAAAGAPPPKKPAQVLLSEPLGPHSRLRLVPANSAARPGSLINPGMMDGRPRYFKAADGTVRVIRNGQSQMFSPRPFPRLSPRAMAGAGGRTTVGLFAQPVTTDGEKPAIPLKTMRVIGTPENRYSIGEKNRVMNSSEKLRASQDTPEEQEKRQELRRKGFREAEINLALDRDRRDKALSLSNLRVVMPANRNSPQALKPSSRFPTGDGEMAAGGQPQLKKKMLPIERAFTNMFGADGSLVPDFACRRRGRPSKDDPTAPSNIIEEFRRHQTQWPPKFDEMDPAEVAELQDLIDQLDATTREEEEREEMDEGERSYRMWENGYGGDEDQMASPWQNFTLEEREKIKAAAKEKILGAKTAGKGCFVCSLFRKQGGKPRTWQCSECYQRGRALTPIGDDEVIEPTTEPSEPVDPPPNKKMKREKAAPIFMADIDDEMGEGEVEEDETREEEDEKEEEPVIDLSAIFAKEKEKVERRGRPKKNKTPEKPPAASPPKQQRTPRESKKKREAVVEEPEPAEEEEVVMGTTRRGRQIKMPAKLKGHEVTTASTTTARRSPSVASDVPSESASSHHSAALPTSSATSTPRMEKKKVEDRMIKQESPEAEPVVEPRSAMDVPRRGGRRRY